MDDNDQKGSRSIPSRTKLGKRAAIIEKFPSLGQPLVLFGGLITIPFWGYRNTPIALLDIMSADLPRVEYGEEKVTEEDVKEAEEKTKKIQERVKTGGLGASLSNRIDTNKFVQSKLS